MATGPHIAAGSGGTETMRMTDDGEIKVYVVEFGDRPYYQLQWRDPITQRTRTKTTKVRRSGLARERKQAERLAAELEAQLRAGAGVLPSRLAWEEFRRRYEAEVVPGLATKTGDKIRGVFNRVEVELNPQRLRDITEARLSHYVAVLRKAGAAETTIAGHLAHLKAALTWAVDQKMLPSRPRMPKIQRARKSTGRPMKGRPITAEEFERMVAAVPAVVGDDQAPHWQHYLRGLWASGLRLGESLDLWWDRPEKIFPVFPRGGRPMLQVPGELEKGNADRLLPIAPEFAIFLLETPESDRTGPVFRLEGRQGQYREWRVSEIVSKIGKAAGVKVYVSPKDPEKVKYASAHDLRRAFGVRWAARLMPAQLMELMRHESIDTTLRFYVGTDAQRTAEAAWAAYEQAALAVFSGRLPNSSPNSGPSEPPVAEPATARKSKPAKALPSNGAAGTRTQDQRIKSPMLYRLSYSPTCILPSSRR
jgi:integrase